MVFCRRLNGNSSYLELKTMSILKTGLNPSSKYEFTLSVGSGGFFDLVEIQLLLAAQCHIGTKNCDKQMEPYVWKRRTDGEYTWAFSGVI